MNHTRIAAEALRYRLNLVRGPLVADDDWDLEQMASRSVTAADPRVDSAIRRVATAWVRAGLPPEELCVPWSGAGVDSLFGDHPELVDALDDIVRVATRSLAA
ncbi:MAG: hypothetical protein DHS20C19_30170 [Acidimicrobiales bacterium]|nr:MAG: hypothetical protein DHS20C19_30170 [Acidimicrobiales bacterium]